jgi:hypothetical protein
MFLAATGARATEALAVRLQDINLKSTPTIVFFRAEYTKTKQDRTTFLTDELKGQLRTWIDYKYREYRSCYYNKDHKSISEQIKPVKRPTDYIFAVYHKDGKNPKLLYMYQDMRDAMQVALKNAGMLEYEDGGKRMKVTLHSFRRFVKTTISDLGHQDYSEGFIGHAGSTYYSQKIEDRIKVFQKIEQYLTFLDMASLEANGADMESRLDALHRENRDLKESISKQIEEAVNKVRREKAVETNAFLTQIVRAEVERVTGIKY